MNTHSHVPNMVQQLNDLNRAKPRLTKQRIKTQDPQRWGELLAICVAVSTQQDNLRWAIAHQCEPWFDGSAFASDGDSRE